MCLVFLEELYEKMTKIERLTVLLSRFPGIGKKTAFRLVYFLLKESKDFSQSMATELADLHDCIHSCAHCGNFTEKDICEICSDFKRNVRQLCIVAHPQDIAPIEDSQSYFGLYHVLGGLISPLEGKGPEQLQLHVLKKRIHTGSFSEVILATNPTIEGETTARYIYDMCKSDSISFTRLAQGIPMGGDLEYTDKYTIAHALKARSAIQ